MRVQKSVLDVYPSWICIRHLDMPLLRIGGELNSSSNKFDATFSC